MTVPGDTVRDFIRSMPSWVPVGKIDNALAAVDRLEAAAERAAAERAIQLEDEAWRVAEGSADAASAADKAEAERDAALARAAELTAALERAEHRAEGWVQHDTEAYAAHTARALKRAEAAEAERDAAIAHDRQPYPTAWAYEQACRALETQRVRADKAEADLAIEREANPNRVVCPKCQANLPCESCKRYSALREELEARIVDLEQSLELANMHWRGLLCPECRMGGECGLTVRPLCRMKLDAVREAVGSALLVTIGDETKMPREDWLRIEGACLAAGIETPVVELHGDPE